jgi:hypothetical protein
MKIFTSALDIVTKCSQVVIFTLSSLYHNISGRMMDIRDFVDLIMGNREVSSPVLRTKHISSFDGFLTVHHGIE